MTRISGRILFLICFTGLIVVAARAQSSQAAGKEPATINGRVIIDNGGAPGAKVMLKPFTSEGYTRIMMGVEQPPPLSATTDAEGRYRLTDVPPAAYRISVFAPAYLVNGAADTITPGKTITVGEGENVENVDFSLTRGAVITGKVTDENGRPAIAAPVYAYKLNDRGERQPPNTLYSMIFRWETDDRGVYRIFGLEAGRYLVAAGLISGDRLTPPIARDGGGYRGAFHPDAVEEARAKIVEVKSGEEAANVDIKVGYAAKGYVVAGRVVEADTDRPVPGVTVNYSQIGQNGAGRRSAVTNTLGEFRFENVSPASYRAFIINIDTQGRGANTFGDEIKFEVFDSDLSGLEIMAPRGATISGVVAIEGSNDPALRAKLPQVSLFVRSDSRQEITFGGTGGNGTIHPNGTFKLSNVQPGKTRIMTSYDSPKFLALLRIEHNGVEVKEFNVNAGDQITGVRLVFGYGGGVIAGRVEVKGGSLPVGARLKVSYRPEGEDFPIQGIKTADVDGRGQFLIEGLFQRTYKLFVDVIPAGPNTYEMHKAEQLVTVAGAGRNEVTLVVDLTPKDGDK